MAAEQGLREAGNTWTKLVVQIAEPGGRPADVDEFSSAAHSDWTDLINSEGNILLSLHPYAWPDFRDPDIWLADTMDHVHACMDEAGISPSTLPIWYTEVGVVAPPLSLRG